MWTDEVDDVLRGDLTCALAYNTPAGGAVVAAVAPIGIRDRELGTVGFTTSLGFGRKLERIKSEPKVALAFHSRKHSIGDLANQRYVLVQGTATFDSDPNPAVIDRLAAQSVPYMGAPRRGPFWDRWLRAYYADRVLVTVVATRIVTWPDLLAVGPPEVVGEPLPKDEVGPQALPKKGIAPRVDAAKTGARVAKLPHQLLTFRGADGYPMVVPVAVATSDPAGMRLSVPSGVPAGGRRAGLLAHDYQPKLIGLECRQHTGWVDVTGNDALYAPHTASGFKAPPNKTILLLANGFMARRGLAKARKEGLIDALR